MNIGYASLTRGVRGANFKSITMKNASKKNLEKVIKHNLKSLDRIIDYNIKNNISLYRISSDIIPFGSSPVNKLDWWEVFSKDLKLLGDRIRSAGIRVSMHPGQYTVLNSPKEDVVARAIEDLEYHNRFLDSMEVDKKSKIILHIGGVYGDKQGAIDRFKANYRLLSQGIKSRLVIENDDKSYNIGEVLEIGESLNIPVVYDNLHNEILNFDPSKTDLYWIKLAGKTWEREDGRQKIHYSQQAENKRRGSHSETIDLGVFKDFITSLEAIEDIDVMLEVKDKNISAMKVINYLGKENIKSLEDEWSKFKYNILEHSPNIYKEIRELLKDKGSYPVLEFYDLIDRALAEEIKIGNGVNAAQHVWGYFKDQAEEKEKRKFLSYLESYKKGSYSIRAIKSMLEKLAIKYRSEYLLVSYYFHF